MPRKPSIRFLGSAPAATGNWYCPKIWIREPRLMVPGQQPLSACKASEYWRGRNLVFYAHGGSRFRDIINGVTPTLGTGGAITVGDRGVQAEATGTAVLDRFHWGDPQASNFGAGPFTVVIRAKLGAVTNKYVVFGRWSSGGDPGASDWYIGHAAGATACTFGVCCGGTPEDVTLSGTTSANSVVTLAARRIGTTIWAFRDGRSNSKTDLDITTVNFTAARTLNLGELQADQSYNSDVYCDVAAIFKSALTDAEIYDLLRDPYLPVIPT